MWGDAEGAYSLSVSTNSNENTLSKSLHAVTGPTHIPYHDTKWQSLLLHYEQLVHLHNFRFNDDIKDTTDTVVATACQRIAQHSRTSSNLAALSLHVSRMMCDLQSGLVELTNSYAPNFEGGDTRTKLRVALIGKARATCGGLNLLRLFVHETIVVAVWGEGGRQDGHDHRHENANDLLRESFTYTSRDLNGIDSTLHGKDASIELISAVLSFLSCLAKIMRSANKGRTVDNAAEATPVPDAYFFDPLSIPEVYDIVVQLQSLMLVLLSTQLYQPMVSSGQLKLLAETNEGVATTSNHYFLERIMDYAYFQRQNSKRGPDAGENLNGTMATTTEASNVENEPLLFLYSCFQWVIRRPRPPKRSIALHYVELTHSIAQQLPNMTMAPDGMYESHSIVMSTLPDGESLEKQAQSVNAHLLASHGSSSRLNEQQSSTTIALGTDDNVGLSSPGHVSRDIVARPPSKLLIPLRSIVLLSSSLFLLPLRLVKLAFRVLGRGALLHGKNSQHEISTSDHAALQHLQSQCEKATGWERTNNILWISDSPVADLSAVLILLLSNNCRANLGSSDRDRSLVTQNPFRAEMATLNDERWDGSEMMTDSTHANSLFPSEDNANSSVLSVNFESLFYSFGSIAHTEVGALLLYTVLQSSPIFAASLTARSDLDTLVIPLLRTLYFSSRVEHCTHEQAASPFITLSHKDRPFRAQSQLYIILILLLIFSQDPSFGKDSFRRVSLSKVKWYKERSIKEISLGSMIILVLIKAITFNLNRLQDEFLLSNCIAVLLNLSPHIVHLHSYVASRLVSVTVSCFKRYTALIAENNGEIECEGDTSTILGMHGETCRTLLQVIKHSIRPKCVDKNLDLVYAILLEDASFQNICKYEPLKQIDTTPITALINRANNIIHDHGGSISAEQTMKYIQSSTEWKSYLDSLPRTRTNSFDSLSSDASDIGSLTFQYEEETDPEIFFVPYIWDVTVGALTASTFEWARDRIRVFPLNQEDGSSTFDGITTSSAEENDEHRHTLDVV